MLNAEDQGTFLAVRELKRLLQEPKKPLVFWIGAGTSKWLGYPFGEHSDAYDPENLEHSVKIEKPKTSSLPSGNTRNSGILATTELRRSKG